MIERKRQNQQSNDRIITEKTAIWKIGVYYSSFFVTSFRRMMPTLHVKKKVKKFPIASTKNRKETTLLQHQSRRFKEKYQGNFFLVHLNAPIKEVFGRFSCSSRISKTLSCVDFSDSDALRNHSALAVCVCALSFSVWHVESFLSLSPVTIVAHQVYYCCFSIFIRFVLFFSFELSSAFFWSPEFQLIFCFCGKHGEKSDPFNRRKSDCVTLDIVLT